MSRKIKKTFMILEVSNEPDLPPQLFAWGIILGVAALIYYVYIKNKKKKEMTEAADKLVHGQKKELEIKKRIEDKIKKVKTYTKQILEVGQIKVAEVGELKSFLVENENSIIEKGGETKLFEFLKLGTFLNDYRDNIVHGIDDIANNYSQDNIERAIIDYENNDSFSKAADQIGDMSNMLSGKQGKSVNAKVELLFKIGDMLKPSIEAELTTLGFYKSLSMAMVIFYLDNKKVRFFEIYEAFEQLGVFDSSWQKNVAAKLESIDLRLAQMNDHLIKLNENFTRIADNTELIVTELRTGLKDISQKLDVNNILLGITAYQSYKINKNTKSLGN